MSREAGLERVARRPAELAADLRRVDRVAAVVAGPIGHERLQRAVAATPLRAPGSTPPARSASSASQMRSTISRLVRSLPPPMLYFSPDAPLPQHQQEARAVILDVQPVADVAAVAVDRQRLALERVENHQRDQLLGKLVRPVVVRAVGDQRPAGRRCGSRRARGDRPTPCSPRTASSARTASSSLNSPLGAERAVHLVGRHVQEAERARAPPARAPPANCRAVSSSTKVPTMLVSTKARGPSIERSTCVSAARFTTAVGRCSANTRAIASRSAMSALHERDARIAQRRPRG